jgi:hypothetical protein
MNVKTIFIYIDIVFYPIEHSWIKRYVSFIQYVYDIHMYNIICSLSLGFFCHVGEPIEKETGPFDVQDFNRKR